MKIGEMHTSYTHLPMSSKMMDFDSKFIIIADLSCSFALAIATYAVM